MPEGVLTPGFRDGQRSQTGSLLFHGVKAGVARCSCQRPGVPGRRGNAMAVDKNMRILIVEDYKTMLRILRNLLNQLGFKNIEEASDGSEALHKLKSSPFELIIADWNMEPMTGFQLLKEVRADEKLKKTPFIMVTAESKTENVIAAKQAGVSNYIVKPFSTETLKTKLASVLGPF
jgi:two-component system chemotaxis response regulator CheY